MNEKLARLKAILAEVSALDGALSLMGWDQQTYLPPGGAEARGHAMGTLSRLSHQTFTSQEVGKLLDDLAGADLGDPDGDDARLVQVTRRLYRKQTLVPPALVEEFTRVTVMAQKAWETAREKNDFSSFRPHLEEVFRLRRVYADLFKPWDHVYDPLLDDFEPGLKTVDVRAIFDTIRPRQVKLIQAIAQRPQVDDGFLHQSFDEAKQWEFATLVAGKLGYDWTRGRQDKAPHPFSTTIGTGDHRITTRVIPDFLNTCLFATIHETGHALYEMGVDPELARTPLASGASLALHESQSRLWENLVGRSRPFWEHFYPSLQKTFPSQLGSVSLDAFYKGINRVEPSLIRVEADEATYNLHIMLRLEIEVGVLEGSMAVKDLPEIWRSRMKEYLGVTPPDDARGVLQDIHWSIGSVGYFPTYALGNLISAQLWEKIRADLPDLDRSIRKGELRELLQWLRSRLHRHGAKFEPQELVRRLTGTGIQGEPYIRYLTNKLGDIYGIR